MMPLLMTQAFRILGKVLQDGIPPAITRLPEKNEAGEPACLSSGNPPPSASPLFAFYFPLGTRVPPCKAAGAVGNFLRKTHWDPFHSQGMEASSPSTQKNVLDSPPHNPHEHKRGRRGSTITPGCCHGWSLTYDCN